MYLSMYVKMHRCIYMHIHIDISMYLCMYMEDVGNSLNFCGWSNG